ncbi:tetratricopeptide repeat protein [Pseudocnuella soli]|uniref:tetratricopeptide repeat protein n=1 Tax=Pseudocnuella soli TaxID=2502779 RepID=UPI001047B9D3|nr:tetratricopeptide repeat protein [Pseudocnuella soli]
MVDTGVLLDRAGLLLAQGRAKDAEVAAREVLAQEPYNDAALALLGRCAFELGHIPDGMGFIREALAIRPEASFYYYLLAYGHYQQEQYAPALEHLETAVGLQPYVAEYYGMQAFVLLAQRQWEAALEKANEGLALEADNLTSLNARSRALNKLRRTDDAMETMQDALAVDPHSELTHLTVAWNYLEKGRHRDAQHHFRETLRLNPNNDGARSGLKEALKSNVAPYRWLLQYSFWLHNKGKKWQTAAPIILYVLFRVVSGALGASESTKGLVWIPVSVYLLLVVTSWTIGPICNFVLLFHPLGKHAVTLSERWSAISVVSALVAGLALLGVAQVPSVAAAVPENVSLELAGILLLTIAFPLGEMVFPLRWKGLLRRQRAAMLLVALGLVSVLGALFAPVLVPIAVVYGIGFILYSWTGIFR